MKTFALLAEFESPHSFVAAVEKVRDNGFTKWDAHTPFPIHGMDGAMGIRGTRLPFIVLGGGLSGLIIATAMQWWMNGVDYPFIISGKPLFGLPAAFPVMFELTILLAAFATFFGMWGLNKLPRWHNPLFKNDRFKRATQDRFFIVIEADDPKFNLDSTRELLESIGSTAVEEVEE